MEVSWLPALFIGLVLGVVGGYLVGAFCASAGNEDLQVRYTRLRLTLEAVIVAAESQDPERLWDMLMTAKMILKGVDSWQL